MDTTVLLTHLIALTALLIGSYTDLRTREVPDWVNIGLIGIGIGVNLIFSIILFNYQFILASIIGFGAIFAVGWIMFYTGQWGGGDSKMLMGLGALLGINIFVKEIPFIGYFLLNVIIVGALYGLLWTMYLILKKRKLFFKQLKKNLKRPRVKKAKYIILGIIAVSIMLAFVTPPAIKILLVYIAFITPLTFYLWVSVKAVEKVCMIKYVKPGQLTEGDWIAKDIKVNGKYIAGPKDLGIEKKQIQKLIQLSKKNKIKQVLIKEGIPFVPSFLLAYCATLLWGNLLVFIL